MNKVKIITKDGGFIPTYETPNAAGADIRTNEDFTLYPGNRRLVHTGIYLELPEGYEAQIRSRSGLALKKALLYLIVQELLIASIVVVFVLFYNMAVIFQKNFIEVIG